eukprot:RCo024135
MLRSWIPVPTCAHWSGLQLSSVLPRSDLRNTALEKAFLLEKGGWFERIFLVLRYSFTAPLPRAHLPCSKPWGVFWNFESGAHLPAYLCFISTSTLLRCEGNYAKSLVPSLFCVVLWKFLCPTCGPSS